LQSSTTSLEAPKILEGNKVAVLYCCLPCLKSVLPVEYYEHFELSVSAQYLRTKKDVENKDTDVSTGRVTEFITESLY
ncbi:hypothetical protein HPB47_016955, partial [Ixodes persulcatus]